MPVCRNTGIPATASALPCNRNKQAESVDSSGAAPTEFKNRDE